MLSVPELLKLAVNVAGDMSRVAAATESAVQRNLLAAAGCIIRN
jgi:hypothetical protein